MKYENNNKSGRCRSKFMRAVYVESSKENSNSKARMSLSSQKQGRRGSDRMDAV